MISIKILRIRILWDQGNKGISESLRKITCKKEFVNEIKQIIFNYDPSCFEEVHVESKQGPDNNFNILWEKCASICELSLA